MLVKSFFTTPDPDIPQPTRTLLFGLNDLWDKKFLTHRNVRELMQLTGTHTEEDLVHTDLFQDHVRKMHELDRQTDPELNRENVHRAAMIERQREKARAAIEAAVRS